MSPFAARLSRLNHATRYSSLPFLYPCYPTTSVPVRRAMMSAIRTGPDHPPQSTIADSPPAAIPSAATLSPDASSPQIAAAPPPVPKPAEKARSRIRSSKVALTISPKAVTRLQGLLKGPTPQLIRVGVRNKGCAGLSYNLDYVEEPGKFDEIVEQDGVRVLIDSRALFSVIGSEMDWTDDALSAKFTFRNPNIKDACGCGESFTVGKT